MNEGQTACDKADTGRTVRSGKDMNAMKKYRWGVLGTGRIARTFAKALNGCEEAELYAVASRSADKAAAFAAEFGFEKSFGSYKELAEDGNVDVVYIATPMSSHYGDAMLCIRNGKNVLCEKSAALNSSQLDEMLTAAENKGVFFMEAMWMKCRPTYLKALGWLREGHIGKPRYVKADFCNLVEYDRSDRLFAPECGGGALLDLAVYPLTLAADFLGQQPTELISSAHIGADGVDLSNSILLRYPDSFAAVNSGFEIPNTNNAVISGEEGLIVFGNWFFCTSEVTLYDRFGREVEKSVIADRVNGYEYEIEEVHRCLGSGLKESVLVPHSSTSAVMKIMDKCREDWGMYYPEERS